MAQDSTEPLSIASSPFLHPRTWSWSWGRVLLSNHLYQIHEGPQPVPNAIAIQSFHEQLLERKSMLRDRILQNHQRLSSRIKLTVQIRLFVWGKKLTWIGFGIIVLTYGQNLSSTTAFTRQQARKPSTPANLPNPLSLTPPNGND